MSGKLEVSFNSPQCGWMSIGFSDGVNEFNTTTAHAPYSNVLPELLHLLVTLLKNDEFAGTLKWNRDPEEFDFEFRRSGAAASIEIFEYPTGIRVDAEKQRVFGYRGDTSQIVSAFYETFRQLDEERNIDEFEENWHQKFPRAEFQALADVIKKSI